MTDIVITGAEQLPITTLAERSATRQVVRAEIGGAPMNVILATPVRNADSYGHGHLQHQQSNTIRWHLVKVDDSDLYTVVGDRV